MSKFMREWHMDPHIRPYVIRFGFYGLYLIGYVTLDWALITSLVERCRYETHTFHLPVGEMTFTLQDVTIIPGLRIHGPPAIGTCDFDVLSLCPELVGVIPPLIELRGFAVSTQWLSQHLSNPLADADEVILEPNQCGFILALLRSFIFADKKGLYIHFCFLLVLRDLAQISTYN